MSSVARAFLRASAVVSRPLISTPSRVATRVSAISALQTSRLVASPISLQIRSYSESTESRPQPGQGGKPVGWDIQPSTTVYVGNLFFDVKDGEIREFFQKFGEVQETKIVSDIRGFSKGFAFVTFQTMEEAKKAVDEAHGQLLAGRRLAVNFSAKRPTVERQSHEPSPTLFVGNLSYDITDRELNQLFRPLKNIRDVRVAIDRRTGQPRGFAHADFTDVESAMAAKTRLDGTEVRGRALKLDYSHSSRNAAALAAYNSKAEDGSEPAAAEEQKPTEEQQTTSA